MHRRVLGLAGWARPICVGLLTLGLGAAPSLPDAAAAGTGTVAGRITFADGEPAAFDNVAVMTLQGGAWMHAGGTSTDHEGTYAVDSLPPGTYRVCYLWSATVLECWQDAGTVETADDVVVADGAVVAGIDLSVAPPGVSGTVTDESGAPLPGRTVTVHRRVSGTWSQVATRSTRADGGYQYLTTQPGAYTACVVGTTAYAAECWRDVRTLAEATAINVGIRTATARGIDFELSDRGSLSGLVTGAGGQTPDGVVRVYPGSGSEPQPLRTVGFEAGAWRVGGLDAGGYRVCVSPDTASGLAPACWTDAVDVPGATVISLAEDEDRTGIDLSLAPAASLAGTVRNEDGATLPKIVVTAYRRPTGGALWSAVSTSTTTANGGFLIGHLPAGTYRLCFTEAPTGTGTLPQVYGPECHDDVAEITTATDVPVDAGQAVGGLDAVLGPHPGAIDGVVSDTAGLPVPGATVTAWTEGRTPVGALRWLRARDAQTLADGSYLLSRLAGTFRVCFTAVGFTSECWQDAARVEDATDLEVPAGRRPLGGIDATLVRQGSVAGTVAGPDGPVAGVSVRLYDADGVLAGQATTGQNGTYLVPFADAGSYRVCFFPPTGLAAECWRDRPVVDASPPVGFLSAPALSVAPGQHRANVDGALTAGASIAGTVQDRTGAPVGGVTVYAVRAAGGVPSWDPEATSWVPVPRAVAVTTADGGYVLPGLSPHRYRVCADRPAGDQCTSTVVGVPNRTTVATAPVIRYQGVGKITGTVHDVDTGIRDAIRLTFYAAVHDGTYLAVATRIIRPVFASPQHSYPYVMANLPAGHYKMCADAVHYEAVPGYAEVCSAASASLAGGTRIPVTVGGVSTGADVHMTPP